MGERSREKADIAPRKRALISCDRCKLRRARCIRDKPDEPCADCNLSGVLCESKLPRKQRVYGSVETLSLRYRALDSLVRGLFPHENVQDLNTLFKLAVERNISMPANDDYRPAEIFSNSTQHRLSQDSQQHLRTSQSAQQTFSPHTGDSSRSTGSSATSSVSTIKESQHNPFAEVQQTGRSNEALIPTRHGVPHYFGPSSVFRFATTVRGLVARCKAAQGDFPTLRTTGSDQDRTVSDPPLQCTSTNPSDGEYTMGGPESKDSPIHHRQGRKKRSRTQMESTNDSCEHCKEQNLDTVGDLLPSRSLADALVSAYFDHVHIYLPLFHRSMFQFRLEATYSRRSESLKNNADMGWLICLCLVFSFGCQQLQEHDPEQSRKLGLKYLGFVKSCFRYLLMTTSIVNVQALVLLNIHHHAVGQKSSSWLLIGLAARMATTMGMHRDVTNMEFDPIERNIRRQVWWSIYSFERIVCSILGRPSVIDDRETSTQIPDAPLLEQRGASAEMKAHAYQLVRMSYKIRQRAYFDSENAEERSPSLAMAESLLRECNAFIQAIPPNFSLNNLSTIQPEPRTRVLLMNVYYYYTRCIVSRDFLVQKVERNIAFLEGKPVPYSEELQRTLILSEDCVDSAHQSLQYIMDSADIGVIGYSCLDLFFVYHSILIVCADFLARPRTQHDVAKDVERKETVRAVLDRTREKKLAATYKILSTIALQFAAITGVTEDQGPASMSTGQEGEFGFDEQQADLRHDETSQILVDMSDVQEDWFMNASTNLGLDFFDLHEGQATLPLHTDASTYPELYDTQPIPSEVDDWTSRSLKGMQTL